MDTTRGTLFKLFGLLGPSAYLYPAPFGKFHKPSIFAIDGRLAWVVQEIVGPLTFLYYLYHSTTSWNHGQWIASAMFVGHYINRALIWPLFMMPSISPSHMLVVSSAALWQYLNGFLQAAAVLRMKSPTRWTILIGGTLFIIGLVGNIKHDKILANLRRDKSGYHVPYGLLYSYISFPNYLCEWLEWTGYAIFLNEPEGRWFVMLEILVMLPRALSGHQFYKDKFAESLPPSRKAILPFLL